MGPSTCSIQDRSSKSGFVNKLINDPDLIYFHCNIQMTDKELSSKKQNLFETFQSAGLEDALKKEMRMKIIEKLQTFTPAALSQSFETRVIVSLISEYLTFNKLFYSNSLFLPETGYEGRTLNRYQLTSFNSLNQSTLKYSVLEHIINRFIPTSQEISYQDREIQTYDTDFDLSIEQKFGLLENQYQQRLKKNQSKQILDIALIRRQIELEFKEQYDRDLRRFKQFEIETIRLNQKQKLKKKYDEYSLKMEQTYKRKMDDLRKQTTKMYDQEESMRKEKDYFSTQQRSVLSQQRQLLRIKQFQMDEKSKLLDMTKHIDAENTRQYQEELTNKIKQYDTLNLRMVEKINYEVGLVKLSLQKQYQDKQIEFLERKRVVDEEYSKVESIKSSVNIIERQNSRLVQQNMQLRKQLQGSIEQISQLLRDNKENIARIDTVKSEREALKEDVKKLEENKKDMSVKLNKYQNQLIATRRELDDARNKTGIYRQQSQDEQIKVAPVPIHKQSAVEDLLKKMEEISKNRRKDIEILKQQLNQ